MLALATAVALAISAALGASTSRADVGSVYFDANNNAAAGETLFNGDLHRRRQRRPGPLGDAQPHHRQPTTSPPADQRAVLTPPASNVATGTARCLQHDRHDNVATGADALRSNTDRPSSTSPPAPAR